MSSRVRTMVAYALYLSCLFAVAAQGQLRELPGRPCSNCRVDIRRVALLGNEGDGEWIRENWRVGMTPDGRIATLGVGGGLIIFDSTGRLVRTAGGRGYGPGEFGNGAQDLPLAAVRQTLVRVNGAVLALDSAFQEVKRFTPPEPSILGNAIFLTNGQLVVPGTRSARGSLVEVYDPQNWRSPVRLTIPIPGADSGCTTCALLLMAPRLDAAEFWIAHPNAYQLQRRGASGELLDAFTIVDSPWFRSWSADYEPSDTAPPAPHIISVRERADGLLIVVGSEPLSGWKPLPPQPTAGNRAPGVARTTTTIQRMRANQAQRRLHVDLIDPQRGVIASGSVDGVGFTLMDGQYGWRPAESATGLVQLEIWKIVRVPGFGSQQ